MFDLKELDLTAQASAGRMLTLRHPVTKAVLQDTDGAPVTITAMGTDSATYRQRVQERIDRLRADEVKHRTSAEYDADSLDDLVMMTVTWSGVGLDGKALPCTHANIRAVYTRFRWVREQVERFVGSREDFFGASSAPSAPGTASSASDSAPTARSRAA